MTRGFRVVVAASVSRNQTKQQSRTMRERLCLWDRYRELPGGAYETSETYVVEERPERLYRALEPLGSAAIAEVKMLPRRASGSDSCPPTTILLERIRQRRPAWLSRLSLFTLHCRALARFRFKKRLEPPNRCPTTEIYDYLKCSGFMHTSKLD